MSTEGTKKAVIFALGGNALITAIKFIVAFITNSASMLAESIHSTADTFNQVLLLIGDKRSKIPQNEKHSFGYANEVFFWALMVAVLLFFVGGLFSVYEGINKLIHPHVIENTKWIFAVLIVSILIEAKSFQVAYRELRHITSSPIWQAIKEITQVNLIVVVLEDSAALIGLIIALIFTTLALLINPVFDAVGSILIGILLLFIAVILMREIHELIIGESLPAVSREKMKNIITKHNDVNEINRIQTMAMGDNKYLSLISLNFSDKLSSAQVEDLVTKIKEDLRNEIENLGIIYIEAQDYNRYFVL